ncbi:MAG: DUF1674 domain-containing protein [Sphingomonadaceae bacterium]|nr:DUF1674 domain-containing protein [Sphingomonadaceae bacterium]
MTDTPTPVPPPADLPPVIEGTTPEPPAQPKLPEEGGPKGPEPTRFGDWERKGIAVDF